MTEMNGEMAEGKRPLLSATIHARGLLEYCLRYLAGDAAIVCGLFVYYRAQNVIRSPSRMLCTPRVGYAPI